MKLWPRRKRPNEILDTQNIDEDQTARLRAAKAAAARTRDLLAEASDQIRATEVHLKEMRVVRSENHFTDLIKNYAFKEREADNG